MAQAGQGPQPIERNGPESAERRDQILDVAERLFAENGFAETSMRAIAQEANVNVATLYYHCGSKEQLFSAIYARVVDQIAALVGDALSTGGEFNEIVARVLDQVVEFFLKNPSIPKLLHGTTPADIKGGADIRRKTYGPLFEMVAAQMNRRAERGEIRKVDPARFLDAASGVIFHLTLDHPHAKPNGKGKAEISAKDLASIQEHARIFILGALGLGADLGSKTKSKARRP
jgi:AcrR family transcriptional regulator